MLWAEILLVAFGAIRANKLRSFLTTLGIIIGIGAVITMVAMGEGAQRAIENQLQSMGSNVLTIRNGQQFMGGLDRGGSRLTAEDAEAIELMASPNIKQLSPEMSRRQQVEYGNGNASLEIIGVWPSFFEIQNHKLAAGRLFTNGEERGRRRLAVLGSEVGTRLGLLTSAALIGETIRVRGITFEVIGVLAAKGEQGFMQVDASIYVPASTAQYRVIGQNRLNSIYVQAASPTSMDAATADIDRVLRREHRIRPGEPGDFNVRNSTSLLETLGETTRTFSMLLAGIAFISLVVGGIGIMNIMLVSVTERTREIGIRKALGARRRDILFQFLVEALVLCLVGGTLGVGVGTLGAYLIRQSAAWNTAVAPEAIAVAFGFSAAVGLFFGIWPARRAAKLDPITALRYE
ncbi:MAG: ABC transporter permease [Longimicrobiales bacterium]